MPENSFIYKEIKKRIKKKKKKTN